MATQVDNGAGFEYACAHSLLTQYQHDLRNLKLEPQSIDAHQLRFTKFQKVAEQTQALQMRASAAFARHLATDSAPWFKAVYKPNTNYSLHIGDDPKNCDVRDLLVYGGGKELGMSLKWNSDEIKGPRMGPQWFQKFHLEDRGLWESQLKTLNAKLATYVTWKEAVTDLGPEAVWGAYRDAAIAVLSQNLSNEAFVKSFAVFNFGKQDYVKVMAMQKGSKIKLGWYDTAKLPTEVVRVRPSEKGLHYFEVLFNNWLLLFRLHNGDTMIKPNSVGSGVKISVTVESWAGKEPEVIRVD